MYSRLAPTGSYLKPSVISSSPKQGAPRPAAKSGVENSEDLTALALSMIGDGEAEKKSELSLRLLGARALLLSYHRRPKRELVNIFGAKVVQRLLQVISEADDPFEALEILRPMFSPWIGCYHALLDVIQANGYRLAPFDEYLDHGLKPHTMYIYHDVHAWDIVPALGLALANKDRDISTTFYLTVAQAPLDVELEDGYRIFQKLVGNHVSVGLHASPFSTWLRMSIFQGDTEGFEAWLKSEQAPNELLTLLSGHGTGRLSAFTRDSARAATIDILVDQFRKLKSIVPSIRSANHHGDPVTVLVRKLREGIVDANRFVDPILIVDEPEARDAGIEGSPGKIERDNNPDGSNNYLPETRPDGAIYCEGGNQRLYLENLNSWLASGAPSQLLNHPASISNGQLTFNLEFAENLKAQARGS